MAREDFISDRLVDIRQRFRQPLEGANANSNGVASLPTMRGSNETGEIDRERRDLEGRLRRDIAQVDALLQLSQQRQKESELFNKVINECLNGLLALGNGNKLPQSEYNRKVEELRIKYFAAYGRFSAFNAMENISDYSANNSTPSTQIKLLPLILTIIGTGILIAIAIIISIRL